MKFTDIVIFHQRNLLINNLIKFVLEEARRRNRIQLIRAIYFQILIFTARYLFSEDLLIIVCFQINLGQIKINAD